MANATFYLIADNTPQATAKGLLEYTLFLAQHFAQQGAKLFVNCQDRAHAEQLAEHFWAVEPHQFLPHNLVGEGPKQATQIEIGFQGIKPTWNRQLIINLANVHTTFAQQFPEVVDFVPCEEKAKQLARERYKIYRQAGYQLQTIEINPK